MHVTPEKRYLLIGYGNPGRGDDGLGPAVAAGIEALDLAGLTVEIDYQLTVDHAAMIAAHDVVVFVDAMEGLDQPYLFSAAGTDQPQALGSHTVTPEAALHLARILFGAAPEAWILAVAGYAFEEVREGLSPQAGTNMEAATAFLAGWLTDETTKRHTTATRQYF
jgi:hydrogenase maturation protease